MQTFDIWRAFKELRSAVLFVAVAVLSTCSTRAEDKPATPRVPWTTSHVSGSPEPPAPFETRRAFPKLTFNRPLDIAFPPGSNRIVVAEQSGKLFSFPNDPNVEKADLFFDPKEILNLNKIADVSGPADTLAITFHPQFQQNHYCYIQYNLSFKVNKRNHENGSRVSRFTVTDANPPRIDPKSELVIIEWLSGGHNGCALKFGPDGFLYLSLGDAGDPNPPDPFKTGQDISDLLCSVLRIDVDHPGEKTAYSIPPDNPFIKLAGARPEVYAYGLRNPFRMNFDSKTGNLWLGDVGWELWEMIHCIKSGGNYGWSVMEGPNPVYPDGKRGPTEISKPQAALFHTEAASITGGLVYRGTKLPELVGYYIFGDWQTSKLWSAKCIGPKEDTLEPYKEIAQTEQRIVAFGEDPDHEPIIVDHGGGGLYRLERNPLAGQPVTFPRKLSETGIFESVRDQKPAEGVMAFSINAPQWLDFATAERFVAAPGTASMTMGKGVWGDAKPLWPKDSVLVRTLSLQKKRGDPATKSRIETQIMHFDGKQWHGYSYAWDDAQKDADLVGAAGGERKIDIEDSAAPGGTRRQTWRYPSRTQCMTCHNVWCDYTLAFYAQQLDRDAEGPNPVNQVQKFKAAGLLMEPHPWWSKEKATLTDPYNEQGDLNERARSYLHVNCSHCHRFGGGGTALFDVRKELRNDQLKAIDERPALGDFGLDSGKVICAGDPNRSVFIYRTSKLGTGRMPQIGSELVDIKGTQLLRQWIASLQSASKTPADPAVTALTETHQKDLQIFSGIDTSPADRAAAADRMLSSTTGAQMLLGEIQGTKLKKPTRQIIFDKAIVAPQETIRDLFRMYDPRDQFIEHLGTNIDRAKLAAMPGDARRGRAVFESASAAPAATGSSAAAPATVGLCANCHRVSGQGKDFGPELTHIATKYTKPQLLENILEPSKTIAEGFATYMLKTKAGDRMTGLLVSKSETEVVLKDQQKVYHVPPGDVEKLTPQTTSAMPEGLLANLTAQEAADLLEYLSTLK